MLKKATFRQHVPTRSSNPGRRNGRVVAPHPTILQEDLAANSCLHNTPVPRYFQVQELKLEGEKKTQELDTAGKALDGKLNESTQFKNLKMMLGQKNELLKDLRARLQKYEVDPPGGEED